MAEAGCVSFKEFNEERNQVRNELKELNSAVVELKTMYIPLGDLPRSIQSLDKTMALMGQNIEQLNKKFDTFEEKSKQVDSEQNKKISNINEKSKIDIIEIIRNNWFKVIFVLYVFWQEISK